MGELKHLKMERLQQYLAAERAILLGQEYRLGDRLLRRADLKQVRLEIDTLTAELEAADSSRGKTKRAVFID